ncbi:MAG: DUF2127 domain-containing protein [Scytolyngbya sp. HA4215-MV1]|jgi:uncharacterized membrane protein (DUF2068 family)|nr:DUF2127 domain-containing protein [Scytolyngbya sp. HA4215-MV1]
MKIVYRLRRAIQHRPIALLAIVAYKAIEAILLAATAIALFLTLANYRTLVDISQPYLLEGKSGIIHWLLVKILNVHPKTFEYGGITAAVYALITAIEAIGLWYEKKWASLLVIGLVGISIPLEVFELVKGFSLLKLIVFGINIAVFGYLLDAFLKHKH